MPPETDPVRVLLVEDDEDDYLITRDLLAAKTGTVFELDWSADYGGALARVREQRHDVYLVDFRLGERTGLDLVREAFQGELGAPVLLLTGQHDDWIDREASSLGVTDYLVKQELDARQLERAIRYAVGHHRILRDLKRSEERYALAVRAANDGLWDWDLRTNQVYVSPRWHTMLGQAEVAGEQDVLSWLSVVHPADLPALRRAVEEHVDGRTPVLKAEHRMRHADGSWRTTLTRGLVIRDAEGRATRMAGSLTDITERSVAEQRLQYDALHDSLTGLANRALFTNRVEHALQRATRSGASCAVAFLDIDRFKLVNDGLGHETGDKLLVALADRLTATLRPSDTVARIGGDEFIVLLDDVRNVEDATAVVRKIHAALTEPFDVEGRSLVATASIGVCVAGPQTTAAELLRNADIAMYDAKRLGGAESSVFDESMHRCRVDRLSRESELRRAVEQRLLEVHFQPIVELSTGRVRGLEALARWPSGWAPTTPAEFIPIAEETGMIRALGLHVLKRALDALAVLRHAGRAGDDVTVSVNVSARQLDDPELPAQVCAALLAADLPGAALVLEVTESALMRNPERLGEMVASLCATGVGLHLDDFGTGFSSLSTLEQLPVDALKVDRSFVSSPTASSEVIVRSTIALAHNLDMRVIAEGIEGPGQLERLRQVGCEYGQGYLFSRPVPLDVLGPLLRDWPVTTLPRRPEPRPAVAAETAPRGP